MVRPVPQVYLGAASSCAGRPGHAPPFGGLVCPASADFLHGPRKLCAEHAPRRSCAGRAGAVPAHGTQAAPAPREPQRGCHRGFAVRAAPPRDAGAQLRKAGKERGKVEPTLAVGLPGGCRAIATESEQEPRMSVRNTLKLGKVTPTVCIAGAQEREEAWRWPPAGAGLRCGNPPHRSSRTHPGRASPQSRSNAQNSESAGLDGPSRSWSDRSQRRPRGSGRGGKGCPCRH
jgi:hypothetical protein